MLGECGRGEENRVFSISCGFWEIKTGRQPWLCLSGLSLCGGAAPPQGHLPSGVGPGFPRGAAAEGSVSPAPRPDVQRTPCPCAGSQASAQGPWAVVGAAAVRDCAEGLAKECGSRVCGVPCPATSHCPARQEATHGVKQVAGSGLLFPHPGSCQVSCELKMRPSSLSSTVSMRLGAPSPWTALA